MEINSEEISEYEGEINEQGLPHGKGILYYSSGEKLIGTFKNGQKTGKCILHFGDGSFIQSHYDADKLIGTSEYNLFGHNKVKELSQLTSINGHVKEFTKEGFLTFDGFYKDSIRQGPCWIFNKDGGSLFGIVDNEGHFTGDNIAYIFPDKWTALVGNFKDGFMNCAKRCVISKVTNGIPEFQRYTKDINSYEFDESTNDRISRTPMIPDPYEFERVYIKPSLIPGANEGLFSKVDVGPGVVMSFYSGIRISPTEVDNRDWSKNCNTMILDDDTILDVPEPYCNSQFYCATLGHKVNHSFTPNCEFDSFQHPRFGTIKCVKTLRYIKKGEELSACYGYENNDITIESLGEILEMPDWYRELWIKFQKELEKRAENLFRRPYQKN